MCSEISSPSVTSPRISFSHDIRNDDDLVGAQNLEDDDQAKTESSQVESANANEFDFSFSDDFLNESSSADELFSEGLIRPIQLQDKFNVSKHGISSSPDELFLDSLKWPLQPQEKLNVSKSKHSTLSFHDEFVVEKSSVDELFPDGLIRPIKPHEKLNVSKLDTRTSECLKQDNLLSSKESTIVSNVVESEHKHQSKSFWRIDRSSSVHCVDNTKRTSFWSLPLMSRSNSTGSVPSGRQIVKENKRQISHKHAKNLSNSSSFYMYQFTQKPPLKKNHGGSYGNGAWANPSLNAPPPYIAKGTANLFGLTSLFKDKKDKKTKK